MAEGEWEGEGGELIGVDGGVRVVDVDADPQLLGGGEIAGGLGVADYG